MVANRETEVQRCLVEFYGAAQRAIARKAYGELVYGCFAACMYCIRTKRNVTEIFHHADGFRRSTEEFVRFDVLDTEEMFLLECMWEKVVWYIARLVNSRPSPMVELFPRLGPYCQPLSLGNYSNGQSRWMEHSYCEIKAKFDFITVLLWFNNPGVASADLDSGHIAEFLTLRFYRDLRMSPIGRPIRWPGTQDPISSSTVAKLWSELFRLIGRMLRDEVGSGETTSCPIFSILNLVQSIESDEAEVVDISLYALTLAGLVVNQRKDHYERFGYQFFELS
jgi:hypothetical protein